MKIDILERKNGILLINNNSQLGIIIEDSILPENPGRKFEFIEYKDVKIIEDNYTVTGILVNFTNDDYIEDIYSILINRIDDNFNKIFSDLNSLFKFKKEPSWEEFRGYVGEALFIMNLGGIRTKNEMDTFDIFLGENKLIEVKTYSRQKKSITISHEQLVQGVEIYTVPLINDEKGMTIIEISEKINDPEFAIEIKNRFRNSIYESYKFQNVTPKILEWRPEIENELPKGIFSANYNMNIEKPE